MPIDCERCTGSEGGGPLEEGVGGLTLDGLGRSRRSFLLEILPTPNFPDR